MGNDLSWPESRSEPLLKEKGEAKGGWAWRISISTSRCCLQHPWPEGYQYPPPGCLQQPWLLLIWLESLLTACSSPDHLSPQHMVPSTFLSHILMGETPGTCAVFLSHILTGETLAHVQSSGPPQVPESLSLSVPSLKQEEA